MLLYQEILYLQIQELKGFSGENKMNNTFLFITGV